jgi:hypothetical protein
MGLASGEGRGKGDCRAFSLLDSNGISMEAGMAKRERIEPCKGFVKNYQLVIVRPFSVASTL